MAPTRPRRVRLPSLGVLVMVVGGLITLLSWALRGGDSGERPGRASSAKSMNAYHELRRPGAGDDDQAKAPARRLRIAPSAVPRDMPK